MYKKYTFAFIAAMCLAGCGESSSGSDNNTSTEETPDKGNPDKPSPDKDNPDKDNPDRDNPDKDNPPVKSEIPDADGDTIRDEYECSQGNFKTGEGGEDTDGDGKPDYLDDDSDNDTIPDRIEAMNGGDPKMDPAACGANTVDAFRSEDADMNGIPDAEEAQMNNGKPLDTNGDTIPDFCDIDNDGDGVSDEEEFVGFIHPDGTAGMDCDGDTVPDEPGTVEHPFDCDGDTIPDYMSSDSDGDTVPDKFEAQEDSNKDGFLDRYSQDSDGDTVPDSVEMGPNKDPLDTDGDGRYDFQSLDSDNDGVPDAGEVKCSDGKDSRIFEDTDGDGQSDLAEYAVAISKGEDPAKLICNADVMVQDYDITFYFELPLSGETSTDKLDFEPQITKADIFVNIDDTGSMQTAIDNLKLNFTKSVVPEIRKRVPDSQFGLSIFRDFDAKPVWQLYQAVTSDINDFQNRLNEVNKHADATDMPEAGYESLYEIATGDTSKNTRAWEKAEKPSGDNIFGGAGFRKGALPIIIHITDAPSNEKKDGHSADEAITALNSKGIRVIHIGTPFTAKDSKGDWPALLAQDGQKMAESTHSVVPVCAYKTADNWECGTNKCCTNAFHAKSLTGADPNSDKQCVLAISPGITLTNTMPDGTDALSYKTMLAIEALVKYSTYDVSTRVIGEAIDEKDQVNGQNVDTSCFIQRIEALTYEKPDDPTISECLDANIHTQAKDFSGNGYMDGFENFAVGAATPDSPKSKLSFNVIAQNNNCVKPSTLPRSFSATIQVYNPTTDMVFAEHKVAIVVPGDPETNFVN